MKPLSTPSAKPLSLTRAVLGIFLPVALILCGLLCFVYLVEVRSESRFFEATEQKLLGSLQRLLASDMHEVVADVRMLANHHGTQELIAGDSSHRHLLEHDFLNFSTHKGLYDQIRYLDQTGMEVVRVNYNQGLPSVVPTQQLQNKGKRYYFTDAFALQPNQVFASPLDLNMEQGVIEQPLKPMLRMATPVQNSKGEKRGIILVNYMGKRIIETLTESYNGAGDILLVNSDGYFLKGHQAEDEWGFMYPDGDKRTIAVRNPQLWDSIQGADSHSLRNDDGLFTFRTVRPVLEADRSSTGAREADASSGASFDAGQYRWHIVSHVPPVVLTAASDRLGVNLARTFAVLLVLLGLAAWYLGRMRKRQVDGQLALAESAVRLTRSNADLQEFAYIASHDLQEPLRKITAFGSRLQAKYGAELGDQGRDYLQRMTGASRRMQSLIEDLLTYSRVTTTAQACIPVDLEELAREVLSDLETRIEDTQGRIDLGNLPTIEAEPTQMRQLLQNLIGNALKFHRPEQPPIVSIQAESSHLGGVDSMRLTVKDNGIGFDAKYAERIFGPFQRLHGRGEYQGTGIGLSVCRKIVSRHGGYIQAVSEAGKGSTFTVHLPLKQQPEQRYAA